MPRVLAILLCVLTLFAVSVTVVLAAYDGTIYQAQKALKERGYNPGALDGLGGKKTEEALRKFQQEKGLPVSGKLDEKTKEGLGIKERSSDAASSKSAADATSSKSAAWESYQQSSHPADVLVKRCAAEAGIPANDPKHPITPGELLRLTSCIDRSR